MNIIIIAIGCIVAVLLGISIGMDLVSEDETTDWKMEMIKTQENIIRIQEEMIEEYKDIRKLQDVLIARYQEGDRVLNSHMRYLQGRVINESK